MVSGRGYWTGAPNTLTFVPAPPRSGVHFVRADLPGSPRIHATAEHRISMPLRTRLSMNGAEVDMVEHVMAAIYGLGIDNIEVHCTSGEMPGLDGSSQAYVLALQSVGRVEQDAEKLTCAINETIHIGDETQFIRAEPAAPDSTSFEIEYQLDYGDSIIGQATYQAALTPELFAQELAPARTFITQTEANMLQSQGVATHVTERDLIVFGEDGPINNELRFIDECARHKALDLVGDLALTGVDLVGRITARRSGHQMNGHMAEQLRTMLGLMRNAAAAA